MSQDIISDKLNQIMNAKRTKKNYVVVKRNSKLLLGLLEIAKAHGYIESYKAKGNELEIKFNLNNCRAIKPRFTVQVKDIDKYARRYLPARNFGIIVVSTSSGLMTHDTASEKNIGGSLMAYFY